MQRFIVGLGNPGLEYARTRHNIGFLVIDHFASLWNTEFKPLKAIHGDIAKFRTPDDTAVTLVKPNTFMNHSGQCVQALTSYYGVRDLQQVLVLCDDVELPFGTLRLRLRGSHGGQNGLRSIETHLKSREYPRLRIGIGRPEDRRIDLAGYVLGDFPGSEYEELMGRDGLLSKACAKIQDEWLAPKIQKPKA
jgi:PTH1 family peptidyl-tRNA hydrolase